MASSYQLLLSGQPEDATLHQIISSIDVEESLDMPAAIQLTLPLSRTPSGDIGYLDDSRFAPLASISLVVSAGGSGAQNVATGAVGAVASAVGGGSAPSGTQCIFDGYVLSQRLHIETGITNASLTVWGQDVCWLMNRTEKVKEWVDVTDATVAASIFADYGITPSSDNSQDDSPAHTEDTHSLMQRGSDIAFLRTLARRSGKICRVACADQPGVRTGYFAVPNLSGQPSLNLTLNSATDWTVNALDLEWDAMRPTAVTARSELFSDADPDGANGDASDSGLTALADRTLAQFTGQPMTVLLATAVDSVGELTLRAQGVLRESDWFVRCEGEADAERLGAVLRAGMLVNLVGVGAAHSGSWLVWTVRHKLTPEKHTMSFTLVRNAINGASSGGAAGLSSVLGAS
jgi:phage protein D